MIYFFKTLLIGIAFTSIPLHAFINIESMRQSQQQGFVGSTGLAIDGEMGNSEQASGTFSNLAALLFDESESLMMANYSYGESRGLRDTNKGSLHLRHTRLLKEWPDPEVFTQVEFDEFQLIELRTLYGAGARFSLLQSTHNSLVVGAGAFYEVQKLEDVETKRGVRANLYLSHLLKIEQRLSLSFITYYQPYIDEVADYWLRPSFALEYSILKSLGFSLSLDYSYNSRPAPGVKTGDLVYNTGLQFRY